MSWFFLEESQFPVVSWLRLEVWRCQGPDCACGFWWQRLGGILFWVSMWFFRTEMAGVCGGSGFKKVLSTLSSASIAMSHISRLSGSRSVWVSGSEGERVLGRLGLVGGTGGGCAWSVLPVERAEVAACCCLSICFRNCCCSCCCRSFRWSVASLSAVPGARLRELLSVAPCVTVWGPAKWLRLHGEVASWVLGGSRVAFCWQLLYLACSTDGSKSCLFALVKSTSRGGWCGSLFSDLR